jgi:hypothetical protein
MLYAKHISFLMASGKKPPKQSPTLTLGSIYSLMDKVKAMKKEATENKRVDEGGSDK